MTVAVVTGAGGSPVRAIARLAGPDASNAAGQTIDSNGGWVMS